MSAEERPVKPLAAVLRWRALAEEWGPPAGVPVALVLAIIHVESAGRPDAGNFGPGDARRGGARGLMQMTLTTAHALGFPRSDDPDLLYDPSQNVRFGARLLAQLVHRFAGDFRDVACGYNSGKGYAKAPPVTREVYAPRVLAAMTAYAAVLAPPVPPAPPEAAP